ncbi:MAG: hypothetical protein O3A37_02235 [Planctomycetota bacterium]|nr:hypothetical protein [Planctomycetota bacterium]
MEFVLSILFLVALPAALLSGAASVLIWRTRKPFAKLIAIVLGVVLFVALAWAAFVTLIVWSSQQGHPF